MTNLNDDDSDEINDLGYQPVKEKGDSDDWDDSGDSGDWDESDDSDDNLMKNSDSDDDDKYEPVKVKSHHQNAYKELNTINDMGGYPVNDD